MSTELYMLAEMDVDARGAYIHNSLNNPMDNGEWEMVMEQTNAAIHAMLTSPSPTQGEVETRWASNQDGAPSSSGEHSLLTPLPPQPTILLPPPHATITPHHD